MRDGNQLLPLSRWTLTGPVRVLLLLCAAACCSVFISAFLSSAGDGGTLNLTWTPNRESDIAGYNIYRTTTGEEGYSKLNASPLKDTSYRDTGLIYGTIYYYAVTAVDTAANESPFSAPVIGRIDSPTGVNQEDTASGKEISGTFRRFQLSQNYPNPFNPITNIRYVLPTNEGGKAQKTVLRIYDIQGKLVRTLVDEFQPAGVYLVQWDTKGDDSRKVAAGIYLCQLISGRFMATRKMVVLK